MLEFRFIDGEIEKSLMLFNRDFDALSSAKIRRSLIHLMESRNQIKIPPQSMIYVIGKVCLANVPPEHLVFTMFFN